MLLKNRLDFAQLYREEKRRIGRPAKTPQQWDKRAHKLRDQPLASPYATELISHIDFTGARTLLDVGCGAGNIAIQVAQRLDAVYGLDYSPVMLDVLMHHARTAGLANVHPVNASWDDDWDDVPVCDLVVASRSTLVEDMGDALQRLHRHARQRVYITYPASGFFAPSRDAGAAQGQGSGAPDYMFILNILRQQGVFPTLQYIQTPHHSAPSQGNSPDAGSVRWALIAWDVAPA